MVAYNSAMETLFKALGDPSRLKLLAQLHGNNGQTLGGLCGHLDMSRQAATKHLVLLEGANLVVVKWVGREKRHYLNPDPFNKVADWVESYRRFFEESFDRLDVYLKEVQKKEKKHGRK